MYQVICPTETSIEESYCNGNQKVKPKLRQGLVSFLLSLCYVQCFYASYIMYMEGGISTVTSLGGHTCQPLSEVKARKRNKPTQAFHGSTCTTNTHLN
jgi:hypothetical protein